MSAAEQLPTPPARHRLIVAGGFRLAGALVAAPSLVAALWLGWSAFVVGREPKTEAHMLDISTYGLVGLLSNAATGMGAALSAFNGIMAGIAAFLAVVAAMACLFGVALYLVGRGLKQARPWARVLGLILAVIVFLGGVGVFLSATGLHRAVVGLVLAAVGYAFWVLGWRFKAPAADATAPV